MTPGRPRIGIYRACGIGDAVQLTPLFQQIRADLPEAELVFFTSENVLTLFRDHPSLDRAIGFTPKQTVGLASRFGNAPHWLRIRRSGPWDFFLNFEPRLRASLAFKLVNASQSTGYVTSSRWHSLYTHPFAVPKVPSPSGPHISSDYLEAWQRLAGYSDRGFGYDMSHLLAKHAKILNLPERFLCLAPGSGNFANFMQTKVWPYWMELADLLRSEGWCLVWLGGPDDAPKYVPPDTDCNLLGRIDLVTSSHVLARSAGLIGLDSGMFHLALGLGVPAAAFFGPTSSAHVGPFRTHQALVLKKELPCVPCQQYTCLVPPSIIPRGKVRPFCMTLQHPAKVLPALLEFFNTVRPVVISSSL